MAAVEEAVAGIVPTAAAVVAVAAPIQAHWADISKPIFFRNCVKKRASANGNTGRNGI